ncbi:MAG: hypothetical protein R2788_07985 [Saprospiraceae bacterium]
MVKYFFIFSVVTVLLLTSYNPGNNGSDRLSKKMVIPPMLFQNCHFSADELIQPLRNMVDNDLQCRLERQLNANQKWKQLIAEKNGRGTR